VVSHLLRSGSARLGFQKVGFGARLNGEPFHCNPTNFKVNEGSEISARRLSVRRLADMGWDDVGRPIPSSAPAAFVRVSNATAAMTRLFW
jgi:hypothetical protein